MSLFCDAGGYDTDGADWWWYQPADEAPLATKRSRKCCSCGKKVGVGETARKVRRFRPATEWEEMRGFGDEVQLSDWYLCETCGDLADSLAELGFCYSLGDDSLAKQIDEYRREEAAHREYVKTHNAEVSGAGTASAGLPGYTAGGNYGENMLELDKIHCGDNCDLLGQLPRECIDLVVTSPPYDDLRTYGGHSWDFFGVAWQLKRVLKPGGVIVWVVADATKDGSETGSSMEQALHFKRLGLNLHDTMIYASDKPPLTHNRYEQAWEFAFILSAGRPSRWTPLKRETLHGGKGRSGTFMHSAGADYKPANTRTPVADEALRQNIWWYATGNEKQGHPAPFPIAMAVDFISTWSNPGDLVLDPFSGSGTTAKAAKELGRRFLGLEINPEYCAIAERRLAQQVLELEAV